jgi:hypothetical protein
MQVTNYIFRSPYPSQVQVGTAEHTTQQNSNSTKRQGVEILQDKNSVTIKSNEVKAQTKGSKLTDNTSFLDIYA